MELSQVILLCSMVLIVSGALNPALSLLKLKKKGVLIWLGASVIAIWIEYKLGALVLFLPSLFMLYSLHWRKGVVITLISSIAGGGVAVLFLIFVTDWIIAPSIVAGILSALIVCSISRYGRMRLAGGLAAIPIVWLFLPVVGNSVGALAAVTPSELLAAAVVSSLCSALICACVESFKIHRRMTRFA